MATVYAVTSLDLEPAERKTLFDAIELGLAATFRKYDLSLDFVPTQDAIGEAKGQTNIYILVPPYMEDPRRAAVVKDIYWHISKALGPQKPGKVVVRFQHHPDDCCGDYGEMRDVVKARAAEAAGKGG